MCSVAHLRPHSRGPLALLLALAISAGVVCAQQLPPAPNAAVDIGGAAKLLTFTGQVSVMRDTAAWALNIGDLVQPQQVVVTGPDGWGLFQVSDGSKFEVFPNSRVVFRQNRSEWKDLLELWLGKVRVQIEHFGNLPNNNRVHTPSAVISVRGTVFDVTVNDDITLVEDIEGHVAVRHLLRPGPERLLNPGESIQVFKNEPLAKALVDKGAIMQRAAQALRDALYQAAINAQRGATSVPTAGPTTSPADKDGGNAPPAPPPPPPPPPPGPQ